MHQPPQTLELGILAAYLVLVVAVGFAFSHLNRNTSDFFRGGARATWWLAGASAFMGGFSAWSFTGAAGSAYLNGWSIALLNVGNAGGFLLGFAFFGAWIRQTREVTGPGIIRARFNEPTRLVYACIWVLISVVYAAIHLYSLALFSASVFGLPLHGLIEILGVAVAVYSAVGGSWAVMATDFLHGLILVPITITLTVLALAKFHGPSGFIHAIDAQGLHDRFAVIKPAGSSPTGAFTAGWAAAIILQNSLGYVNLTNPGRYPAVKDGREARRAALLGFALTALGAAIWFVPPIAARLLFADRVQAMPYARPEETAYAVASLSLLPRGLVGVMVVAIVSSTMSSMGPGLNGNAGILVYDLVPLIRRAMHLPPREPAAMLKLSRFLTILLGTAVVALALGFADSNRSSLFDLTLTVGAMLATPLAVPMFWCLWIRAAPAWSALAASAAAFAVSATGYYSQALFGARWPFQTCVFANFFTGTLVFFAAAALGRRSGPAAKAQATRFFTRMHTPVDFSREVGLPNDGHQLRLVGAFAVAIGGMIGGLVLTPGSASDRRTVLIVAASITVLGLTLWGAGKRWAEHLP